MITTRTVAPAGGDAAGPAFLSRRQPTKPRSPAAHCTNVSRKRLRTVILKSKLNLRWKPCANDEVYRTCCFSATLRRSARRSALISDNVSFVEACQLI